VVVVVGETSLGEIAGGGDYAGGITGPILDAGKLGLRVGVGEEVLVAGAETDAGFEGA
jgi:hypothetical protein